MNHKIYFRFHSTLVILLIIFLSNCCQQTFAQLTEGRWVAISNMWNYFENLGGGGWEETWCWPGGLIRQKLPGEFRIIPGCERKFGATIGVQNWTNQAGRHFTSYLASPGSNSLTRNVGDGSGLPGVIKLILRQPLPNIIVDGHVAQRFPEMQVDEVDPTIPCDAEIYSEYNYAVGITEKRRIYYYAPQNDKSNGYLYYDYWFVNSGKVRPEPDSIAFPGQTLHNLGITFSIWPMVAFEGATEYGRIWEDQNDDWTTYYGTNYSDYIGGGTPLQPAGNPNADSLRLWMDWDGTPPPPATDDIGDPDMNVGFTDQSPGHGELLSYQWAGFGILWADKSPTDHTNDLSQPFTTTWTAGRGGPSKFPMDPWYKFVFSGKHDPSSVDKFCPNPPSCTQGDPTNPSNVAAPFSYASVGLYPTVPFGDSVHAVVGVAVGGLSRDSANSTGILWWQHHHGGPGLTDEQKDAIVATGRDSLLETYSLANKRLFENIQDGRNWFAAPAAPASPDIDVESAKQSVVIKWSDVSQIPNFVTGVKDFAGYKIYRRQVSYDSTWKMIWDSKIAGTPTATEYIDLNVVRGYGYQYAVSAYNDGSQNWRNPGVSLESSIFWNAIPKNDPVHPYLGATNTLGNIRVVPNPYNVNSAPNNYPGEPDKLMFVGLPSQCTIKIFTVTGNLVKSIDHTNGTSEEPWNQVTDYNQLVSTGVYLYVVESNIGKAIGKFVIIRQ